MLPTGETSLETQKSPDSPVTTPNLDVHLTPANS